LAELAIIFVALAIGGLAKGATGAGAPLLAIPAMAAVFDVSFAIAMMLVSNIVTNAWQVWHYREHRPEDRFLWKFVGGGVGGAIVGTLLLTALPSDALMAALGVSVVFYILLKLFNPHFALSEQAGDRIALPAGLVSGLLQGATGISAPASITFLNALRLKRPTFIFTISLLFVTFTAAQAVILAYAGIVTPQRLLLSAFAVLPILAFMPVGNWLCRRMPDHLFDRLILVLLAMLAVRLVFDAVT